MRARQDENNWLGGVVVPLVTPFTKEDHLDEIAMREIIRRQLDAEVDGLFVLGSVGEGPMLNSQMRRRVISLTLETVGERVPVFAGAMDNSVVQVLDHLEEMTAIDAILQKVRRHKML